MKHKCQGIKNSFNEQILTMASNSDPMVSFLALSLMTFSVSLCLNTGDYERENNNIVFSNYRCCSSSIFLLFSHSISFCFSISFLETKQNKQSQSIYHGQLNINNFRHLKDDVKIQQNMLNIRIDKNESSESQTLSPPRESVFVSVKS